MSITWSDTLSTGLEWQDRQHKELFRRISLLFDAMNHGLGRSEVVRVYDFLDSYFAVHFDAERLAMEKAGYAGMASHLSEHQAFIEDISGLRKELETGVTTALVIKTQSRLVDWLLNHIGSTDKGMAEAMLSSGHKT